MFADRLMNNIKEKNSCVVAGLDPRIDYVPEYIRQKAFEKHGVNLKGASSAILEFNKRIIDSLSDIIPAVKLQSAYYEMYGITGVKVFFETCKYAKARGLQVIADAKRNDIGATARAYSSAFIGRTAVEGGVVCSALDADAVTVNPYLGIDGIEPFIEDCRNYDKGIFILVKTSNKSSGDFQDIETSDGKKLFEKVAERVNEWGQALSGKNGYSVVGAVVGATYPEQAKSLRKIMKNTIILVPGYGAQGGTAKDAVNSFNEDGTGAIVNASRSIMCAYKSELWKDKFSEEEFAAAARSETIRMRNEINEALEEKAKTSERNG